MERVMIGIPLPETLRKEVERICFGVPNIDWLEPQSLHITIKSLGKIKSEDLFDVKEALHHLNHPPFHISLEGLNVKYDKHKNGSLQIPVKKTPELEQLSKQIDKLLRPINIDPAKLCHNYLVTIGYFHQLRKEHLTNFIEANACFESSPCVVEELCILTHHRTPKHIYYVVEETYSLSEATSLKEESTGFQIPRSYLPKKDQ